MLTDSLVNSLVARAGAGFTWASESGDSRPSSAARRGLRAYLHAAQGGICTHCGEAVDLDAAHTSHVVSRGSCKAPRGFIIGNLMVQHGNCNNTQRDDIGPVVRPEHLARPDLVVTESPVRAMAGFAAYDPR